MVKEIYQGGKGGLPDQDLINKTQLDQDLINKDHHHHPDRDLVPNDDDDDFIFLCQEFEHFFNRPLTETEGQALHRLYTDHSQIAEALKRTGERHRDIEPIAKPVSYIKKVLETMLEEDSKEKHERNYLPDEFAGIIRT